VLQLCRVARDSSSERAAGCECGGLIQPRVVWTALLCVINLPPILVCTQNLQAHVLIDRPENVREYMIEYLTNMKKVRVRQPHGPSPLATVAASPPVLALTRTVRLRTKQDEEGQFDPELVPSSVCVQFVCSSLSSSKSNAATCTDYFAYFLSFVRSYPPYLRRRISWWVTCHLRTRQIGGHPRTGGALLPLPCANRATGCHAADHVRSVRRQRQRKHLL
jgi:hypothetical protein